MDLLSSSKDDTATDSWPRRVRHHSALDADPVAHIKVLQAAEGIFAQLVDATEQLHVARGVAQTQKGDLALNALGHDAAGNLDQVLGGIPVLKVRVSCSSSARWWL